MSETKKGTDVSSMKRSYRTVVDGEFPGFLPLNLGREQELRYGENPNQPGAIYTLGREGIAQLTNIRLAKSGKGGLSATNFMDVTRAMDILKYFQAPSAAVMKHLVPSGFATQIYNENLNQIYVKARDADARSAFGSIVVLNRPVDKVTAEAIMSSYVEGIAAPEFEEGTMGIIEQKKDIRTILFSNLDKIPKFVGDDLTGLYDIKGLPTGRVLVQKPYLTSIKNTKDLVLDPMIEHEGKRHIVTRNPTQGELNDMFTAWYVNFGVRSNGIVLVKGGVTLAVGTGQQERVGAVEQAVVKAYQKAMDREKIKYNPAYGIMGKHELSVNPLEGAVMSSDAFFPFRDSIDTVAKYGVSAIIQPGGSVKDHEVIDAVNKHNMAMAFTLERCFGHF